MHKVLVGDLFVTIEESVRAIRRDRIREGGLKAARYGTAFELREQRATSNEYSIYMSWVSHATKATQIVHSERLPSQSPPLAPEPYQAHIHPKRHPLPFIHTIIMQ